MYKKCLETKINQSKQLQKKRQAKGKEKKKNNTTCDNVTLVTFAILNHKHDGLVLRVAKYKYT